jgi:hypothetical protein
MEPLEMCFDTPIDDQGRPLKTCPAAFPYFFQKILTHYTAGSATPSREGGDPPIKERNSDKPSNFWRIFNPPRESCPLPAKFYIIIAPMAEPLKSYFFLIAPGVVFAV